MNVTRTVAAVVAGIVLLGVAALAVTSFVSAQEGGDEDDAPRSERQERRDAFLQRVAANLGVTVDQLEQAYKDAALQGVDEALAAGRITDEQAAKMRERIENGDALAKEFRGHGHGPKHGRAKHALQSVVKSAATALGIEPGALKQEIRSGKSIADVAGERGVSLDSVKAQITSDAQAKLAERVAAGDITQQQADDALARLAARLDDALTRSREPAAP